LSCNVHVNFARESVLTYVGCVCYILAECGYYWKIFFLVKLLSEKFSEKVGNYSKSVVSFWSNRRNDSK